MAEAPKPCEDSKPRPPGVIPKHRTSGVPRYRCTKRVVLPPPPPVLAPCPGGQVRNPPTGPCKCPPSLPVFFENRICVAACPPGLGLINRGPNGACACPDDLEQRAPNGKCLPKCNLQTHMIDSQGNCVPKPPPVDPSQPITIETEVQMGGFRQSSIQKKGTFDNAERVSVSINPLTKQVTLGEYVLNGIPQVHGFVSRITGKAVPYKVNGFGYAVNQSGDNLEWQLYIKKIEIASRKTGTDTKFKGGIVISFWGTKLGLPCEGTNDTPSPVFIVTEGVISYIQGGKKVTTTREVLEQALLSALPPMPSNPSCKVGGRRNTLKRRNTRKIRGKYKKTKKHRRN